MHNADLKELLSFIDNATMLTISVCEFSLLAHLRVYFIVVEVHMYKKKFL